MIDFHTHILPNVDDGSRSIEETFKLIKEAQKAGFDEIILTSHYKENRYEVEEKERVKLLNEIQNELAESGNPVKFHIASEIYITDDIVNALENRKASRINDTRYVLFELPFYEEPQNLYDVIYEMLRYKIVPILAHPERYAYLQSNPDFAYDLVEKGVLMQSNFGSILGRYGKKSQLTVKKLLQNNYIHFLGSDIHREQTIYLTIDEATKEIKKIIGEEKFKELTTINPSLVLKDEPIDISTPTRYKLSLLEKLKLK